MKVQIFGSDRFVGQVANQWQDISPILIGKEVSPYQMMVINEGEGIITFDVDALEAGKFGHALALNLTAGDLTEDCLTGCRQFGEGLLQTKTATSNLWNELIARHIKEMTPLLLPMAEDAQNSIEGNVKSILDELAVSTNKTLAFFNIPARSQQILHDRVLAGLDVSALAGASRGDKMSLLAGSGWRPFAGGIDPEPYFAGAKETTLSHTAIAFNRAFLELVANPTKTLADKTAHLLTAFVWESLSLSKVM